MVDFINTLFTGGIGWIITQLLLFVIAIIKFRIDYSKFKAITDLRIKELETDITDHKLAYESRMLQLRELMDLKYKQLVDSNTVDHNEIKRDVREIKETNAVIRETVGTLKGMLEQHIHNSNI